MQSFLNKIAKYCIKRFGNELGDATLILPNRRAIVFLTEEFRKELNQGSWLPTFYSIEDFIGKLGNCHQLEWVDLIFELYQTHRDIEGTQAESFEEFMSWGTTLLQDFNEIDRYLIDGQALFSFLTEAKAIEIWELEEGNLTEFQSQYLRFWKKLKVYYTHFRAQLNAKKKGYQGLIFRNVAENTTLIPTQKNLVFAGFNALTTAEKRIIKHFELNDGAVVLWDADEYYLDDKFQEAGKFLRAHREESKQSFSWVSDNLLVKKKTVNIYGVAGNVGQAKLIGHLLKNKKNEDTAVILSDETLLIPTIESLDQSVDKANITMGYPLSFSPIFSWLNSLIQLFHNTNQDGKIEFFYAKDVLHFLTHSISQHLGKNTVETMKEMVFQIKKEKLINLTPDKFKAIESTLDFPFFSLQNISTTNLISTIQSFIEILKKQGDSTLNDIAKECLFELEKTFTRLNDLVKEASYSISLKSMISLYEQLIGQKNISFVGEPLSGLQIMGVLESRTLDFRNVIISSVNEGILPAGKSQNSFIPFDIKKKYQLPSYQEKDAIFAYHFYRAIQRAENVTILYNTKVDALQGGEKGRFIEQLLYEAPLKNPLMDVTHQLVSPSSTPLIYSPNRIEVNGQIKDAIKTILKQGLSPSALNTFINCPLDFYYRYILKLKPSEGLESKIEDNYLGTIVHNSLEQLYMPYLKVCLDLPTMALLKKKATAAVLNQFNAVLNVKPNHGYHRITAEVATQFVLALLKYDEQIIKSGKELIIHALEEAFSTTVNLQINDDNLIPVKLHGKIDRIDSINQQKRIIDYKTGGVDQRELSYKDVNSLLGGSKSKLIQLLLYRMGYKNDGKKNIEAGIISLRNISNGFMPIKESTDEDLLTVLENSIGKMLDSSSFSHKTTNKYCHFCK